MVIGLMGAFVTMSQAAEKDERYTKRCSERILRGTFVFKTYGSIGTISTAAVGRVHYDGKGGCTNEVDVNLGGAYCKITTDHENGSCTYTVEPYCRGLIEVTYIVESNPLNNCPINVGEKFGSFGAPFVLISRDEYLFNVIPSVPVTPPLPVGVGSAKNLKFNNEYD